MKNDKIKMKYERKRRHFLNEENKSRQKRSENDYKREKIYMDVMNECTLNIWT